MGSWTDANIRAWQKASGIEPACGARLEALDAMSRKAYELIMIVELEKSGIRDGDGSWYYSDPIGSIVSSINEHNRCLKGEDLLAPQVSSEIPF